MRAWSRLCCFLASAHNSSFSTWCCLRISARLVALRPRLLRTLSPSSESSSRSHAQTIDIWRTHLIMMSVKQLAAAGVGFVDHRRRDLGVLFAAGALVTSSSSFAVLLGEYSSVNRQFGSTKAVLSFCAPMLSKRIIRKYNAQNRENRGPCALSSFRRCDRWSTTSCASAGSRIGVQILRQCINRKI